MKLCRDEYSDFGGNMEGKDREARCDFDECV